MDTPGLTRIDPFSATVLTDTVDLLARAFVTNPLHVAAFGAGNLPKNRAFFRLALAMLKGPRYVAVDGARPVGFIHWVQAPHCQLPSAAKLRMLPTMVAGLGPRAAWRVTTWLEAWSRFEPGEPHLHLGPIAVHPRARGRHIGRTLMRVFCDELERTSMLGYLETDRPENVGFYAGFGFEVVSREPVLGVPNFFMIRR